MVVCFAAVGKIFTSFACKIKYDSARRNKKRRSPNGQRREVTALHKECADSAPTSAGDQDDLYAQWRLLSLAGQNHREVYGMRRVLSSASDAGGYQDEFTTKSTKKN
jgi:hypothetical protein